MLNRPKLVTWPKLSLSCVCVCFHSFNVLSFYSLFNTSGFLFLVQGLTYFTSVFVQIIISFQCNRTKGNEKALNFYLLLLSHLYVYVDCSLIQFF